MRVGRVFRLAALLAATVWSASSVRVSPQLPEVAVSDNRLPQGRLNDRVLTIDLEAREGIWYPEDKDGAGLRVQAFAEVGRPSQIPGPIIRVREGTEIPGKEPSLAAVSHHASEGMAGLVLGLHILPPRDERDTTSQRDVAPRRLRLVAQQRPGQYGTHPGFGFALQEDSNPAVDLAGRVPGPPIVLTRGVPVEITVLNKLREPTSLHWHAMELESYYDGMAGWSGTPGHLAPMIPPGGAFVAKFVPPRTGTFIYHTHVDDIRQLSSGLYGPLIGTGAWPLARSRDRPDHAHERQGTAGRLTDPAQRPAGTRTGGADARRGLLLSAHQHYASRSALHRFAADRLFACRMARDREGRC